jgi:hypothetical protein
VGSVKNWISGYHMLKKPSIHSLLLYSQLP